MSSVTNRFTIPLALLVGALLGVGSAFAQDTPPLTEEFIFFVNGPNVLIPQNDAQVVDDPIDPGSGNQVAQFNYGNWTPLRVSMDTQ